MTGSPDRLEEYVLGTLSPDEQSQVEAELEHSPAGRAQVRALREALVALAEAAPVHPAPSGSWAAIESRLRTQTPLISQRRRSAWPFPQGWLAVACTTLLVGGALGGLRTYDMYQQTAGDRALLVAFLAHPEVRRLPLRAGGETIGSVLMRGQRALFVVSRTLPPGQAYQAWGHTQADWQPGGRERLVSLRVSRDGVFEVETKRFVALYLSREPGGGSVQPSRALSRVNLAAAPTPDRLTVSQPLDGTVVTTHQVIVSGTAPSDVTTIAYRLNSGSLRSSAVAEGRFTFTVLGLKSGENRIEVRAGSAQTAVRITVR
ncbi:hypothetical protein DEDE109153_08235 [Deinococcus deserti]|uniref:Zinc-finger domain-containing protein n=1 Tax=Deinococcus deserti (strain DSM 17065 / CIP 109153 / LMG 22923 / VCD115) TaxID=546414 RepID=C1D3Q5_DEIDV|nr:hypothetical protein [Deinococcus deserti]ACO48134.1 Hypothetical protein Deide_3p01861 [Deinococcus deserti VCD115]